VKIQITKLPLTHVFCTVLLAALPPPPHPQHIFPHPQFTFLPYRKRQGFTRTKQRIILYLDSEFLRQEAITCTQACASPFSRPSSRPTQHNGDPELHFGLRRRKDLPVASCAFSATTVPSGRRPDSTHVSRLCVVQYEHTAQ
jgi:hypothetical protein